MAWDNGTGSGYSWAESDVSKTYSNVGGSGVSGNVSYTDGDGRVDVSTDSDNDGYADVADPSNELNAGVNEGSPYFVTGWDTFDPTTITATATNYFLVNFAYILYF